MELEYVNVYMHCFFWQLYVMMCISVRVNKIFMWSGDCAGETMVPISWTEMQCPLSGQTEQRKVAKVGN